MPFRFFWPLFAALMGFAIGGSVVAVIHPVPQAQHIEHGAASTDEHPDENKVPKTWGQSLSVIWDRTWDDPVAFYTFVLSIFTAMLAIVSATQIAFLFRADKTARITAKAAQDAANVATRTLTAGQRAWVQITKTSVGLDLIFDEHGMTTAIEFEIMNIGNAPALNVVPYAWLIASRDEPTDDLGREYWEEIRTTKISGGWTIFPKERFPKKLGLAGWGRGVSISPDEIKKGRRDDGSIALYIVCCVDYTYPSDTANHHQTGVILQLERLAPLEPINPDEGTIPVKELTLRETGPGVGHRAD